MGALKEPKLKAKRNRGATRILRAPVKVRSRMNNRAKREIVEGECPMCGESLIYSNVERQDNYQHARVGCGACRWEGWQWDRIEFDGYVVEDPQTGERRNVEPPKGQSVATARQVAVHACGEIGMDLSDGKPQVLVTVEGGLVQGVQKSDPQIRVIVRDYDVEDDIDDSRISKDPQGEPCCEAEW